jgi:hypothetical protein
LTINKGIKLAYDYIVDNKQRNKTKLLLYGLHQTKENNKPIITMHMVDI